MWRASARWVRDRTTAPNDRSRLACRWTQVSHRRRSSSPSPHNTRTEPTSVTSSVFGQHDHVIGFGELHGDALRRINEHAIRGIGVACAFCEAIADRDLFATQCSFADRAERELARLHVLGDAFEVEL